MPGLHGREKHSAAKVEGGQVAGVGDGGQMHAIEESGIGGHGGGLEVQARRNVWFGGIAIFFQPMVDMGIVRVIEAKAAVKEQGKCRVGTCLSISRTGWQQQHQEISPSSDHVLKVEKKKAVAYNINKK
jgi:hypothetical protein